MRHPFDVAWSPEASSSTHAFCSSSWYFAISPRIFSCGIMPASESFVAFTTIMNRMILSPLRAQSLLLLLELRLERITEVVRLEHLANLDFTFHSQKPAISSFVSANGPSITVRLLPENLTRAPWSSPAAPPQRASRPL